MAHLLIRHGNTPERALRLQAYCQGQTNECTFDTPAKVAKLQLQLLGMS